MRTQDMLQLALSVLGSWYLTFQVQHSFRVINSYKKYLADDVFRWVIGCNVFVKLFLETFYLLRQKLPTFPGLSTGPANFQIYIGTAIDVLVCYVALLRINLSYLCLAIFPFIVITFICVLCMRHNRLSSPGDVNSGNKNNGEKAPVIPEKFKIVALLAPHFILCMVGMYGDPDHDGNSYDISNFFLFLTSMLLGLTLMMMRLPASISRGIEPASELLYKASLVVLLLTAHIVAADAFGKKVVLLLLPEVVPPLLWFGLHLDRRTSIIDIEKITDNEHYVLRAVAVAICGYMVVVPKDESFIFRFYWAITSCATSGLLTYIIVLVLRLWPEKVGKVRLATLSFDEALKLLMFWWSVLLKAAVVLFVFGGLAEVYRLSL